MLRVLNRGCNMLLADVLIHRGEIAFRNRGLLAVLLAPAYVLALQQADGLEYGHGDLPHAAWQGLCLAVSLAGVGLRVVTAGTVPRRTSGRNKTKGQVADTLNTTGVYSIVRNPLYVANFLNVLGVLMLPAVWWLLVLGVCAFWTWYGLIILAEEHFLRGKFGAEYERWAERTPAVLPSFRNYRPPTLAFSARTAIKREYLTLMATTIGFLLVIHAEELARVGPAAFSPKMEVLVAGCVVLAACLVIRILRHRTRLLHVAGR